MGTRMIEQSEANINSYIIEEVVSGRLTVVITKNGKPVAVFMAIQEAPKRKPGRPRKNTKSKKKTVKKQSGGKSSSS